ncbi:hypothetical protein CMK13_01145 [Candidatus Poribacteria bacterium]|nr:hypothetical protein [Candidatus Poribacteria bacterium]OUT67651.1 MAG: hypothetical protein CBB75_00935 [bacterium TMED15]
MAIVSIPSLMRDLTNEKSQVEITGTTIRELLDNMESEFPGVKERLCHQDDGIERISLYIGVYVDGMLIERGMRSPIGPNSEVHFLPAMGGGC